MTNGPMTKRDAKVRKLLQTELARRVGVWPLGYAAT